MASKKKAAKKAAPKKTTSKKTEQKKPKDSSVTKASPHTGVPQVGTVAPSFSCVSDAESVVTLSGLKGKPVVLYFYPKDSTPGCTIEACDFRDSMNRVVAAGAVVLGVSRDTVASHLKFKTKYQLNFPLLADVDGKLCEAYGVWQEKVLYGRRSMGIVRSTFLIDKKGKIAAVWPKVKVDGHVSEVLAELSKLG